jgi:glycosyltransferase involved in cell wall biosynthesis
MRFLMVTTFFGAESFGGEAVYIERLCDALLRRGHEVHVVHDRDAFEMANDGGPLRPYRPQEGLHIHTLSSRLKRLAPLWTLLTGRPGPKWPAVERLLEDHAFDVVHFHNIAQLGGARLVARVRNACSATLLQTQHDLTFASGRAQDGLDRLDTLIFPSRFACEAHAARHIIHRHSVCLPYFVPNDMLQRPEDAPPSNIIWRNPFFLLAGRVTHESGFHTVLPVMRRLPSCEVHIAGEGPYLDDLKKLSAGMPNVRFLGTVSSYSLQRLYDNAAAVLVPSLQEQSFNYVAVEGFARGRPVIARHIGALPELVEAGGGLLYGTDDELEAALRTVSANSRLRRQMGESGRRAAGQLWSEEHHMDAYLRLTQRETAHAGVAGTPVQ